MRGRNFIKVMAEEKYFYYTFIIYEYKFHDELVVKSFGRLEYLEEVFTLLYDNFVVFNQYESESETKMQIFSEDEWEMIRLTDATSLYSSMENGYWGRFEDLETSTIDESEFACKYPKLTKLKKDAVNYRLLKYRSDSSIESLASSDASWHSYERDDCDFETVHGFLVDLCSRIAFVKQNEELNDENEGKE